MRSPSQVLTLAQQSAFDNLNQGLSISSIVVLHAGHGFGATTILNSLQQAHGGVLLDAKDFIESAGSYHPLNLEGALYNALKAALERHDVVLVDDLHLILQPAFHHQYPRSGFAEVPMLELSEFALRTGKKLIVSTHGMAPTALQVRSYSTFIPKFESEDYCKIIENTAGADIAAKLNLQKIFHFAPKLNARQIATACVRLLPEGTFTTERFVNYLRSQQLAGNVDLSEVQAVDFSDLQGVDDVLRSLEIHIVLPLETDPLKNDLGLRPKRGVLLYGPPGTGKTTIGRALAHRLRGRFFLIDGTFIAGTGQFYHRIVQLFEAAKENSPAVIFIDDADAIFEGGEERGLYRFLLTILDGLESEGNARICVMMTAMNLSHLPPALVRSGRVELWLEMKLPDEAARQRILQQHTAKLPKELNAYDVARIVELTAGFTGADLKRLVEDAKGLYAFDRSRQAMLKQSIEYFIEAVAGVQQNKSRHAEAEQASRSRPIGVGANTSVEDFGGYSSVEHAEYQEG